MKREDEIRQLAERIWEERGCPAGRDVEHWREAEKRLWYADVARIRATFAERARRLPEYVAFLDEAIQRCNRHRAEYVEIEKQLKCVNRTLVQLGAEPLAFVDSRPAEDLARFMARRIDELKSQGKI